MCVALKYDAYSLGQDYTSTATTTGPSDLTTVDDDATPSLFSTVDRRNLVRATQLPAVRLCRPPAAMTSSTTHAHCDEHLYEPPTNHDSVTCSHRGHLLTSPIDE